MTKITFPKIFTTLALLALISCTKYIYVSRNPYQSVPVVVDGNAAEWGVPLKYYDDKSKLQYSITNDNENLYICIKATEDQTQFKIFRSGLQIWIDTTAKNEHQAGVTFPLPAEMRRGDQMPEMPKERVQDGDRPAPGKAKLFNNFIQMDLSGFKPPVTNGMTSIQNPYGILAGMSKDSIGILTYEAVIPFRTFYKNSLTISDSLKLIGVSIVLKALPSGEMDGHGGGRKMPEGGGEMPGGGRGMPGGGGGMSGGGMPGGGGGMHGGGGHGGGMPPGGAGPGAAGMEYMNETNVIKKIFQLAVRK